MTAKSLRFILPSLLGVFIFLTPVRWNGQLTIVIGIVTEWINALMGEYGLHVVIALTIVTGCLTLLGTLFRVWWIDPRPDLKELFDVPLIWLLIRLMGMILGLMYFFQLGPAALISEQVGGAVFVDIGINMICVYTAACFLLPLLTDFGFMEFGGTLARSVFRRVFQLPGRAAIDATTSFVGASSIGMLITIGQYNSGNYSARQACVIATNFSVVSLPFCLVIANVSGIGQHFIAWYCIVVVACLLAAFITPRLPPLSGKAETYAGGAAFSNQKAMDDSLSLLEEAWQRALQRAETSPGVRQFFVSGVSNLMFFFFSVVPASLALATFAILIVFNTPVFTWLTLPFIPVLEFAQLPDAASAAPGILSGYLDQYTPAIIAAGIDSGLTSFVLAGLAVCQLIFMSEAGVIILRSSLPLSILDLVLIFLLRTVIVLPVLIVGAHLVVSQAL